MKNRCELIRLIKRGDANKPAPHPRSSVYVRSALSCRKKFPSTESCAKWPGIHTNRPWRSLQPTALLPASGHRRHTPGRSPDSRDASYIEDRANIGASAYHPRRAHRPLEQGFQPLSFPVSGRRLASQVGTTPAHSLTAPNASDRLRRLLVLCEAELVAKLNEANNCQGNPGRNKQDVHGRSPFCFR